MAGDLWNSLSAAEQEEFGHRRVEDLLRGYDDALARFGQWDVAGSSRLAEDNAATRHYRPMTYELHYLISSATDHLDALADQIRVQKRLRPFAPFTLIRSAIESLALVHWLQIPGTLDKRVLRLLQLQWHQRGSIAANSRSFGLDPEPNTRAIELMLDEAKAARRGLNQRDYRKPMASITDVFIEIDRSFKPPLAQPGLNAWRACSGVTHGNVQFSFGLTTSSRLTNPAQGGATEQRTLSLAGLSLMFDPAIRYLDGALDLVIQHGRDRPGWHGCGTAQSSRHRK